MKKLLVLFICEFILALTSVPAQAQISYCKDILEPGNPPDVGTCDIIGVSCTTDLDCSGGALACLKPTLKTWDETWEMNTGETIEVDIWLNNVPESMLTAGCYITYDPALVSIIDVVPYDSDNGGPWDALFTTNIEPSQGEWLVSLGNLACVTPDGDSDVLLAKVTFEFHDVGDAEITIDTISGFDTIVGCFSTVYDPQIDPVRDLIELSEDGRIVTDKDMKTKTEGLWAAGDVTVKLVNQVATAIGDGATAATSVEHYISHNHVQM